MDKKTTLEMIAAISNAKGISGFEDQVVETIRPYAEKLGEVSVDRMRNLYLRRRENTGSRPVVQLDAHSDEVGFMVQAMTDYSFYSQELADGESAALVVRLWESSLEDNQIASSADVQEVEMGFEIREGYTTIDEPVVTIMFGK